MVEEMCWLAGPIWVGVAREKRRCGDGLASQEKGRGEKVEKLRLLFLDGFSAQITALAMSGHFSRSGFSWL